MTRNDHNDHYGNGKHPEGKDPVKGNDLFTNPWMPGLVHVEFEKASDSGVIIEDLGDAPTERRERAHQWPADLWDFLRDHRWISWKASFPLIHSGSKRTKDDAIDFYRDSGRQKFVTFRFAEGADVVQIAANLSKVSGIEQAKPVAKVLPPQIDDKYFGDSDQVVQPLTDGFENQWYAHRCKLPQALAQEIDGEGVIIAAIDWGFDVSHPDYSEGIKLQRNVKYDSEAVGNGNVIHHGTAVLGLAGARINSKGMVGFAPRSILWAIQAGEDDEFNPDYWVKAIDFVRETDTRPRRKVIILEAQTAFRGNIESNILINKAIRDAVAYNVVVCVPAGNAAGDAGVDEEGNDIQQTGSILVGATTMDNVVIGKTGPRITVYAPGDPQHDLTCTSLPDRYTNYFGGTSSAVAKVAGAAALLLEADSSLTPVEVGDILQRSQLSAVDADRVRMGPLLDCGDAVYSCTTRQKQGPEPVLTKYSAMV